ncbi:hypothetical protein C7G65_18950, partial [Acinetobacter baumannii]
FFFFFFLRKRKKEIDFMKFGKKLLQFFPHQLSCRSIGNPKTKQRTHSQCLGKKGATGNMIISTSTSLKTNGIPL